MYRRKSYVQGSEKKDMYANRELERQQSKAEGCLGIWLRTIQSKIAGSARSLCKLLSSALREATTEHTPFIRGVTKSFKLSRLGFNTSKRVSINEPPFSRRGCTHQKKLTRFRLLFVDSFLHSQLFEPWFLKLATKLCACPCHRH